MADILTREERSKRMSLIRSKWTRNEVLFHNYLKGYKIRHVMHPSMDGSPDIILPETKIAIFLHGCFWHGCKRCFKLPENNRKFWENKIATNSERDKKNARRLRSNGWNVRTIWEHQIPRHAPDNDIKKILTSLSLPVISKVR